ncbi:snRNA-activating protein complex subunit 3-like [Mya arenaria]|uniref:snRNA-activating protein complex subunit 3-like n=1 Tax=Mya arenaria TaxID=6604 RepID=UPI0022E5C7EC|nr:snRNA-activating protein complex subunit 3-like [Mya arenaria]
MSRQRFEASELINVRDFLAQWSNDVYIQCATDPTKSTDLLAEKMNMSEENVKELESVCSLDLLNKPGVETKTRWDSLEKIPPQVNLYCTSFQKKELDKRKHSLYYAREMMRKFKYKRNDLHSLVHYNNAITNIVKTVPEDCRVIYPDVILTVNIHRGVKTFLQDRDEDHPKTDQLYPSNTLLVLGRQKLTDLRDVVRCVHDLAVAGDASENPDADCQNYAKDIYKSGFFFINNTFYNDLREDDARDYSQLIRDWASDPDRQVGPFETQRMEETTFLDLTLRLGHPYLYLHQGDCEHLMVISDIKLLTKEHPQDVRDYPYLMKKYQRVRTACRVCTKQAARWITYGSEFTPENPCFFCDVCFRSLHYDLNNKKIGDFEAYRFFDHQAIV